MASLSPVIVPAKVLKGGKHKIRISLAHNGETRYILTDIIIDSAKEFKNGRIVKRTDAAILNTKLRNLLTKYQSALDEVQYLNGLTCAEAVELIKNSGAKKNLNLGQIAEEFLSNTRVSKGTIRCYTTLWRRLKKYVSPSIMPANINYGTVLGYINALETKNLKPSTIKESITFFITVINYAKKCGYVEYKINPFVKLPLSPSEPRNSWINVDGIKKIRDLKIKGRTSNKVRDIFMLSYYLGGINMADLIKINFNEQQKTLHYVRQKTEKRHKINKFVEFEIPEEAKVIIERWAGQDGFITFKKAKSKASYADNCTYHMKKIAELSGYPQLIYYSARKSFAQHAFDLGISESVIDYILGHKLGKEDSSLYSYIKVTPEMATAAIRKVLDNLK